MNSPSNPEALYARATCETPQPRQTRHAQNWILNPLQDALLIIGAPLIILTFALAMFQVKGAADATTFILLLHVVLTVAHHLPTFIRIYGDADLFRRFKWSFVLGPVIPFTFAMGILTYLNLKNYSLDNFFYIFIMLALWDPWHFLMQHYGFMRIYDRHNTAPKQIAAQMDMSLCATWFVFILAASGDWLPGILEDMYNRIQLPVIMAIPVGALSMLADIMRDVALLTTAAYIVYLVWCWQKNYFISTAKIALFSATFAVMYFTYTPNAWILQIAPEWTFKVGFAALGIVHMTQYLAIVWRYNRSLTSRPERSRPGMFRALHARGGWLIGGGYVLFCLAYGELLTTVQDNRWLMALILATGFTSTLMHYYFDGFIWKMRHHQNRENLAMIEADHPPSGQTEFGGSWWNSLRDTPAKTVFLRQCLYFGLPIALLTGAAMSVWSTAPPKNYLEHMYNAYIYNQQGLTDATRQEAELALSAMNRQLPFAEKIVELQPTAAREAALAFLIYNQSYYAQKVIPVFSGTKVGAGHKAQHLVRVELAIHILERALSRGDPLGHPGHEAMTPEDARHTLDEWRSVVLNSSTEKGAT